MKKFAVAILFCFALPLATPAQAQQSGASSDQAAKLSAKVVTLAGIVALDGKSFLCDKDNRTWTIVNPDLIRELQGVHATLRARLDSAAHQLLVASAKPSRDERHPPRLDDAAFRK